MPPGRRFTRGHSGYFRSMLPYKNLSRLVKNDGEMALKYTGSITRKGAGEALLSSIILR